MTTTEKQPNAKKWTAEIVSGHLLEIEKEAKEGYMPFLRWALNSRGLPVHVWSYWKRIFADNDDILEKMLFIDSLFEAKVFRQALHGQLDARIAIRTLKYVYKWGQKNRE
jgi:hypothetical protein